MSRLPSPDAILAWLRDNPGQTGKREIARAFGLKGADKVALKQAARRDEARGHDREAPPPRPPAGRAAARPRPQGHRRRRATATSGPSRPSGRSRARRGPRILIRDPPRRPRPRRRRPPARADARPRGRARRSPPGSSAASAWGRGGSSASTTRPRTAAASPPSTRSTDRDWLVAPARPRRRPRGRARRGRADRRLPRAYGLPRARVVERLGPRGWGRSRSRSSPSTITTSRTPSRATRWRRPRSAGPASQLRGYRVYLRQSSLLKVTIDGARTRATSTTPCGRSPTRTFWLMAAAWHLLVAIADVGSLRAAGQSAGRQGRSRSR